MSNNDSAPTSFTFAHTYNVELANGTIGYIPNKSAYPEGNYEVESARVAEGSGEMLVTSALRMLAELHREAGAGSPPNRKQP